MKKLFTLVLLAFAVLYFSPAANARTVHKLAKHKHAYSKHHHGAHKNAHKHLHGLRRGKARV
jgi:hypothetical protein